MPAEAQSIPSLTLRKPWPQIGRIVVILTALLGLVILILSYQVVWESLVTFCRNGRGSCGAFSPAEIRALKTAGISSAGLLYLFVIIPFVNVLVYYSIAGLILWRRADNPIGLLTALWFVVVGAFGFAENSGQLFVMYPELLLPTAFLQSLALPLIIPFLALFPTGIFVPRWTRWLVFISTPILIIVNFYSTLTQTESMAGWILTAAVPFALISIGLAFTAQIIRYRKYSTPAERQQTKWVVAGIAMFLFAIVVMLTIAILFPGLSIRGQAFGNMIITLALPIGSLCIPISVGVSLLRYRLWDIDVLIRRTLVYGVLTLALGMVFFGGVALLQRLFQTVSGQQSAISVVISTLVIAALFNPMRRRVQDFIDRRFYRKKYNAEQALKRFTELARNVTDVEQLSAEMVAVIQESMQPEKLDLWIKPVKEK